MWFNISYKPDVIKDDMFIREDGTKLLLAGEICGCQTEQEAITRLIRHFVSRKLNGVTIKIWR